MAKLPITDVEKKILLNFKLKTLKLLAFHVILTGQKHLLMLTLQIEIRYLIYTPNFMALVKC